MTAHGEPLRFLESAIATDTSECILWPYGQSNGYGVIWLDGRRRNAHVVVLEQTQGPAPSPEHQGAHLPVECHTRLCVNRRHVRWATPAENNADKTADGVHNRGERCGNARLTAADVYAIRDDDRSHRAIAAAYGVTSGHVCRIKNRTAWAHLPDRPN